MPELPEVEVCRRGLEPELLGALIEEVVIRSPKLRHVIPVELRDLLPGCRIVGIQANHCTSNEHHLVLEFAECLCYFGNNCDIEGSILHLKFAFLVRLSPVLSHGLFQPVAHRLKQVAHVI